MGKPCLCVRARRKARAGTHNLLGIPIHMRHSLSSRAAGLALVAVLAGHAAAGINTVSSSDDQTADAVVSAAVGSVLTIDGDGFGTVKPKVFLTDGNQKKYILKVTAFSDTQITAEIKKAVAGDLTLNVKPKGVVDPLTFDAVTIEAPVIDELQDHLTGDPITSSDPNQEFMITGHFLGTKKGKIFIGGKKAKVLAWLTTEIHVVMPKTLANGLWPILLDNKVATDDTFDITMVNNDGVKLGKLGLNLFVNDSKVGLGFGKGVKPGGFGVVAVASNSGNPLKQWVLAVPFVDGSTVPEDYVAGTDSFIVTYAVITLNGGIPSAKTYLPDEGFTVNITANTAGQVAGNFFGTLTDPGSAETIDVHGDFIVDTSDT